MRKRVWLAVTCAALIAAVMLFGAAPAYADDAPRPSVTTGAWVVVLGGLIVIVVAGLAVAALRRAAVRRRERESQENIRSSRQ
jgi:predicted cobalt transporter CbtA